MFLVFPVFQKLSEIFMCNVNTHNLQQFGNESLKIQINVFFKK